MNNMHGVYVRDLDLNLLRVFAVVADEGSITRAASRLYLTQPAVSAAMRRLAEFVGAELVARQGRGTVLTTRGAELALAARAHLGPLVAATLAVPVFDPKTSTASVRLGLADPLESLLLPRLLGRLREAAPSMQLIVLPVQFRTVEAALLTNQVDLAVTVADELPRSISRQPLVDSAREPSRLVCLYDPRFTRLSKTPSESDYFAQEHVAVSYAGDARGIVEDALGKTRNVRVSLPAFGHVADVVDGSPLVATVHALLAEHIIATRPHLRSAPVPFSFDPVSLDLLWLRTADANEVLRFLRDQIVRTVAELQPKKKRAVKRVKGRRMSAGNAMRDTADGAKRKQWSPK